MKLLHTLVPILLLNAMPALAAHPCAGEAKALGAALMKLHFGSEEIVKAAKDPSAKVDPAGEMQNWSVEDTVKVLKPIKPLVGKGKLDVLELNGNIYKTTYRMHFIYAQIPGSCALLGQEIFEVSNPY